MNCVVVLQARSNSSRLPGKSFMHFRGLPLVVLAARRAASTGLPVIVAISDDPCDDVLASILTEYGVACARGPLDDVLGRFVRVLADYSDDVTVVRLTGDNLVPDGVLIKEVVEFYLSEGLDYITTTDIESGLPYGVAVEVTQLANLREADRHAVTMDEREHVTPYIKKAFGRTVFRCYNDLRRGHFRATIDCLDDILSLHRVFPENEDPVKVSWRTLVDRVHMGLFQPTGDAPVADMVLGTAQLGMPYGITNSSNLDDVDRSTIIKTAIGEGVQALDTAAAYGRSEEVIGAVLAAGWTGRCTIVTKLSPMSDVPEDASHAAIAAKVEASVLRSCLALRQSRIDTLLLHRATQLKSWDGAVWRTLLDLRTQGRIKDLGVSVQSPEELLSALSVPEISHIQLPFNILDYRWEPCLGALEEARLRSSITVHARSALLQGLLTSEDPDLWKRANVDNAGIVLNWLSEQATANDREDVSDLCLAYARSQGWIDGVVVGCDDLAQLRRNISLFRAPPLSKEVCEEISETRPHLGLETLDPALWRKENIL